MTAAPLILFGAFDRHNLGDLLFPHLWAAHCAERELIYAGLAQRDLTAYGGHRVQAIAQLAKELGDQAVDILHVGGELLGCSLYEAAVMTLAPDEARAAIAQYDQDINVHTAWAQNQLHMPQSIGYLVPRKLFPKARHIAYHAVGGTGLDRLPAAMREEVIARLQEADHLSVRDRLTQSLLQQAGIPAPLVPDSAHRVAELFGQHIKEQAKQDEPAEIQKQFKQGYLAVQFSADFGDDPSLRQLAAQLDACGEKTGLGIVLFRAGAAPWHDELAAYRRLSGFMRWPQRRIFESLNLWAICALLSQARAFCGSSLHGRIVAQAVGVAGVSLVQDGQRTSKTAAYCSTWLPAGEVNVRSVVEVAEGIAQALALPPAALQAQADQLADQAQEGMTATLASCQTR